MMKCIAVFIIPLLLQWVDARSSYIINGKDVDYPGKYPWQGSFQINGGHICGCSLISKSYVITAAHCYGGESVDNYRVVLGLHDKRELVDVGKPKVHRINWIHKHSGYVGGVAGHGVFPHDIALIQLQMHAEYNQYIQPIRMQTDEQFGSSSDECIISGWGAMKVNGNWDWPNILQEVDTNIISNKECHHWWGEKGVKEGQICIHTGISTACNGDSGGPLACKDGGEWTLVGATSYGAVGCTVSYPIVYTRIAHYIDWIYQLTDGLSDGPNNPHDPEECMDHGDICAAYTDRDLWAYCSEQSVRQYCCVSCQGYH